MLAKGGEDDLGSTAAILKPGERHRTGRILVTGGAGFIGRHIVAASTAAWRVTVLDDLSTGSASAIPDGVDLVMEDVADEAVVERIVSLEPDVIVHAAAQASVVASTRDPQRDRLVNVEGTRHVAEAAKRLGGRLVIFLSSGGAIYGETRRAATERTRPRPISIYGAHKWRAEQILAGSGVPYRIVRLANVFGPGQRSDLEGGVVAIFADRLRRRQPVTIYGTGTQERDFVSVRDVVAAIETLMSHPVSGTWNVATGKSTTILELLSLLEAVNGPAVGVEYAPARTNDVRRSAMSPTRIVRETHWRPTTDLRAGIAATMAGILRASGPS